ncbi:MAG: Gfo/Idh/MocA family oxidoreductase [Anaerolineae bacterium]|nr:Gfo/Idh/MocA family oxidoreductase [Anaerolineae bacterium]
MITVGQVGLGQWGPNVLRNLMALPDVRVKVCCDVDEDALRRAAVQYPGLQTTNDYRRLLDDPEVQAVVVTAPSAAHYELSRDALLSGRDVFVEKPLALTTAHGQELVALAEAGRRVLMVGHLLLYHPAVARLKQMVDAGELGQVYYIHTSRLNLGQVRRSENAMWSLAPHDISVVLYLLGEEPVQVAAQGLTYLQPGIPDTVFLTLRFASGRAAHVHVSWLDPHKVRRITVVGSQKMAVFDDVEATEKLRIYDKGVNPPPPDYQSYGDVLSLRFGDIYIPRVDMREPLRLECQHFAHCVATRQTPLSDGRSGLQVLRVLEAGQRSLEQGGAPVALNQEDRP